MFWRLEMTDSINPLIALSNQTADLVQQAAGRVVAVYSGGRRTVSGIHWRPGIVVTAEEALGEDDNIKLTLPGGAEVAASLAGRDPTTDIAVLRFQPDGLAVAEIADAGSLRPGQFTVAVGNYQGAPLASLGIVAFAGGPWQSQRGGAIDSFIRLDLALNPAAEGGALVNTDGRVVGMAVLGPRRRVLAIPAATIDRVVDQLLAKGHVYRGYLGAGLQPVWLADRPTEASGGGRGVLVVSVDPQGPAARAGVLVGDIVTAWDAKRINRVREVIGLLGSDSVGRTVELGLLRGGAPLSLKLVIGERAVA
jgi:S1-C subfamily serine protease